MATPFNLPLEDWWASAIALKGEDASLNGHPIKVIVDAFERRSQVNPQGGKMTIIDAQISLSLADWQAAGGAKGQIITLAAGAVRVRNSPDLTQFIVRLDCASPNDQMTR